MTEELTQKHKEYLGALVDDPFDPGSFCINNGVIARVAHHLNWTMDEANRTTDELRRAGYITNTGGINFLSAHANAIGVQVRREQLEQEEKGRRRDKWIERAWNFAITAIVGIGVLMLGLWWTR